MNHFLNTRSIIFGISLVISFSSALSQENLALSASELLTSHVSSWEDLSAINNNIDPESSNDKAGGAYGNWTGTDELWHWVEYGWDQLQYIDYSEVYWWTDEGGIQIPYESFLEYWDFQKEEWLPIPGAIGNGTERDRYNRTTFPRILTQKIRLHMVSSIATGILEWKVWGFQAKQVPVMSSHEIDMILEKGGTSTVIVSAKNESSVPVEGYEFVLNIEIDSENPIIEEAYIIDGIQYTSSFAGYKLAPTSSDGEIIFSASMPALIDPKDGIRIEILFNDGVIKLGESYSLHEAGNPPPVVSPDMADNTVDHVLDLTFEDDPMWRSAIQHVYAGDSMLIEWRDYEILPGIIQLIPAGGNSSLTETGSKTILIEALGYEDVFLHQEILPGLVDVDSTSVRTLLDLYQPTKTSIEIVAKDQYGNPVEGSRVVYHITVKNEDSSTAEIYEVDGREIASSQQDQLSQETDANGVVFLSISIPRIIDLHDGISIDFELEGGIPVKEGIHYFNDGTQKEIVLQMAVRNNAGFSWDRTAQSENFIVYWGEKIVGEPTDEVNGNLSFDPAFVLNTLEELLNYFNDTIGFIENPDTLNMGKYKHEVVMNETWESGFTGWAFGGWADEKIGGMWIHPNATHGAATLAHEFTHMNQCMVFLQYPGYGLNTPYAGFFWECHAQFMMKTYMDSYAIINPERYIFTSMMQFSTTRRHYQNVYFMDYLQDKYGLQAVNDIWRKADPERSHPLTSLRDSVLRYSQEELNDDFGYFAMRNVSWDYSTGDKIRSAIKSIDPIYVQREHTILDTVAGQAGKFIVPEYLAPGDYGYNIVPLFPAGGSSEISIDFEGMENEPAGGAGWRYGFVALDDQGNPRYSPLYSDPSGSATFPLQSSDSAVFLVVSAAPDTHHNYKWEPGYAKVYRYPYTLKIAGAIPAGYKPGYNSQQDRYPGAPHPNGGGWVASTASVSQTAYVGPNAQVLGEAKVLNDARIEDYAIITDKAIVQNSAIVRDQAIVGNETLVRDQAIVEKSGRVFANSTIKGSAVVTGSALLYRTTMSGQSVAKDLARLWGCSVSGTAIIGGDAEEYTGVSAGTYLDITRISSKDGRIDHPKNLEVNPRWPEYVFPQGEKPAIPVNLRATEVTDRRVELSWERAGDFRELESYYLYKNGTIIDIINGNSCVISELSPSTSYTFAVKAVDRSGNVSELSELLDVATLVAVDEEDEPDRQLLRIYPNPVGEYLHIVSSSSDEVPIRISDASGRIVYRGIVSGECRLHKSMIGKPGVYFLSSGHSNNENALKISIL